MTNFDRAMAYLNKLPNAISGAGGHDATLRAACECVRFGLTDSELRSAMDWYNLNRCQPQWTAQEIEHKITSAQAKAKQGERVKMQNYSGKARTFTPPIMAKPAQKPIVKPVKPAPFDAGSWAMQMISDGISFTNDDMETLTGTEAKEAWRKWGGVETKPAPADEDAAYWDFVMSGA